MLSSENISYEYPGGKSFDFPNLVCKLNDPLLLLGDSGTGKTTLLHLLSGLLAPTKGKVIIDGVSLYALSGKERDKFRGEHIGIVFQTPHFIQSLTVLENLLLPAFFTKNQPNADEAKALLERLNIGDKWKSKPNELSVGEQQRVAIARAVINKPRVILADEPTSALDDTNSDEVIQLLSQQASENNAALVIVTHDSRLKSHFNTTITL